MRNHKEARDVKRQVHGRNALGGKNNRSSTGMEQKAEGKDQRILEHEEKGERTAGWFQTEGNGAEEKRGTAAPTVTNGRTSGC